MTTDSTTETPFNALPGWAQLGVVFLILAGAIALFVGTGTSMADLPRGVSPSFVQIASIIVGVLLVITFVICLCGFFVVNPNESRVLVLFGKYRGTVRQNGFFWTNPFTIKHKVSIRARNLNGEKLKVNDKSGNPIEIAAVVVWKVRDTAEALFDVDDYEEYVSVQSESAVRHLASVHPYDADSDDAISLRRSTDEIAVELQSELDQRLAKAGVEVVEARLTHLAYAPEIASAMLQRQQADAIISARQKIVDGAVGMVQMALAKLQEENVVELDEERKASMVSNLLVTLCSEQSTQPVVNTGTLYS